MKFILLVEAEAFFAGKFTETFESAGYVVRHAKDASAAMRLLEINPDDYLLVCCRPVIRGPYIMAFQFMEAARQKPDAKNMPFLCLNSPPNESEPSEVGTVQKARWNLLDEWRTATAIMMYPDAILAATAALLSHRQKGQKPDQIPLRVTGEAKQGI